MELLEAFDKCSFFTWFLLGAVLIAIYALSKK